MVGTMQVVIALTPEPNDGTDELAEALRLVSAHRAAGHYVVVDNGEYASALALGQLRRSDDDDRLHGRN